MILQTVFWSRTAQASALNIVFYAGIMHSSELTTFHGGRRNCRLRKNTWRPEKHWTDWIGKLINIITHRAHTTIQQNIGGSFQPDKLTDFLNEVRVRSQFRYWLFGHYHGNQMIAEKFLLLYDQIVRVL